MKIDGQTIEEFAKRVQEQLMLGSNPQETICAALELAHVEGYHEAISDTLRAKQSLLEKRVERALQERQEQRRVN